VVVWCGLRGAGWWRGSRGGCGGGGAGAGVVEGVQGQVWWRGCRGGCFVVYRYPDIM